MKKEYFATVLKGLEQPVEGILRKTGGIAVSRMLPGAAIFKSVKEPKVPCLQRTFELLGTMRPEKDLDAALRRLSGTDSWLDRFDFETARGLRFRIVTAMDGQPTSCNMRYVSLLEKNISEQTGMLVSRERPQVELWVNVRQEAVYFLWRLDKKEGQKNADPLRRDLCEVLAFLAMPQGAQSAVLGVTGINLPDALRSQGAASISAVPADQRKGAGTGDLGRGVKVISGSPGCTGLPDASQNAVFVCLAPKGGHSIQEEAVRGTLREADRILAGDGRLVTFYPKSIGRSFRRREEMESIAAYSITLSGENCQMEVFRKA